MKIAMVEIEPVVDTEALLGALRPCQGNLTCGGSGG